MDCDDSEYLFDDTYHGEEEGVFDPFDEMEEHYDEYDSDLGNFSDIMLGTATAASAALAEGDGGAKSLKGVAVNKNGTGYGGDARLDKQQRRSAAKQAKKRETALWKTWHEELKAFVITTTTTTTASKKRKVKQRKNDKNASPATKSIAPPNAALLNSIKQVLRWNAPDWWWKRPQKPLYVAALQACLVLTERFPEILLSNENNDDSPLCALQELALSCRLLVKQLEKQQQQTKTDHDMATGTPATGVVVTQAWLKSQLSTKIKQDHAAASPALPAAVMAIYESAKAAAERVAPPSETTESSDNECCLVNVQQVYRQTLRPLAFDTVEAWTQPSHYFSQKQQLSQKQQHYQYPGAGFMKNGPFAMAIKKARKKTSGSPNNVKSKASFLWKEISTFPTSLPIEWGSSIFVRAVEHDMEQLRVLMIGPADTPYANGCFFFDVQLHDYPHCAPRVQFLTTRDFLNVNNVAVRFNPNLYQDGKVCLSLLGTWSGPGWVSGESTLLQVLVSIQSLIIGTPSPYFNEPGYEGQEGTPSGKAASNQYNKNIRRETLRVALLPYWKLYGPDAKTRPKRAPSGKSDPNVSDDVKMAHGVGGEPNDTGKRKSPWPSVAAAADTATAAVGGGTFASASQKSSNEPASKNVSYFSEFESVLQQHFRLKKAEIEKQIRDWHEKDPSPSMTSRCQLVVADIKGCSKPPAKCSKGRRRGGGVTALAVDNDEDLQKALVLSLLDSKPAATVSLKPSAEMAAERAAGTKHDPISLTDDDDGVGATTDDVQTTYP